MKSVMTHQFSQVPKATIQRSSFDRSSAHKTTFNSGVLIPIYCDEALPGDTFNLKMTAFSRLSTPIKPVMDNMFMETFWFAVPNRLVWTNWERFNGAQDNPGDPTDYLIPQINSNPAGYPENSIYDYLGLPTGIAASYAHSALPLRAINLIWNTWFRDENLQQAVVVPMGDGPDVTTDYALLSRGKRHDYFTSCLPWPQKGDSVTLPLGESAPVKGLGKETQVFEDIDKAVYETGGTGTTTYPLSSFLSGGAADRNWSGKEDPNNPGFPGIYADLSEATAATINQIRQAFQVQRLLERDARGGTRYTEIVKSHFGVSSPDSRLQRPELLGTGSSPVHITPIAQTTQDIDGAGANTPQGNLAATGTSVLQGHGFTKSFTEHCIILGFVNVRADLTYQRGLDRMWSRLTRFDFFWPALAHLGEQAVLSKEIYLDGTAGDETVFGYQERSAEYRYKPSLITGQFRSQAAASLDVWHLSQDFGTRPVLGDTFITDKPPIDRIVAVPSEPQFIFDSIINLRCARPMPLYGIPGFIDHF